MNIWKAAKRAVSIQNLQQHANSSIVITNQNFESDYGIPYEFIPGPKPLPLVGNSWRFLPYIGEMI